MCTVHSLSRIFFPPKAKKQYLFAIRSINLAVSSWKASYRIHSFHAFRLFRSMYILFLHYTVHLEMFLRIKRTNRFWNWMWLPTEFMRSTKTAFLKVINFESNIYQSFASFSYCGLEFSHTRKTVRSHLSRSSYPLGAFIGNGGAHYFRITLSDSENFWLPLRYIIEIYISLMHPTWSK